MLWVAEKQINIEAHLINYDQLYKRWLNQVKFVGVEDIVIRISIITNKDNELYAC